MSCKTVEYKDEVYPSKTAFVEAYGITRNQLRHRTEKGLSMDEVLNPGKRPNGIAERNSKAITCFGVPYSSIKDLAEHYGLKRSTLSKRLNRGGMTPERAVLM
ncbi:hypothetical protein [Fusibacter sp. JL216-2]|uniref:hypothetical protein n=1 Tax=Fusibacter sp. JL216-2 TaxID=3071453 RepID=UPI003D356418